VLALYSSLPLPQLFVELVLHKEDAGEDWDGEGVHSAVHVVVLVDPVVNDFVPNDGGNEPHALPEGLKHQAVNDTEALGTLGRGQLSRQIHRQNEDDAREEGGILQFLEVLNEEAGEGPVVMAVLLEAEELIDTSDLLDLHVDLEGRDPDHQDVQDAEDRIRRLRGRPPRPGLRLPLNGFIVSNDDPRTFDLPPSYPVLS